MQGKCKLVITVFILFISLLWIKVESNAKEKVIGSFRFTYQEYSKNKIWITQIDILQDENISVLKIPSKLDGKDVVKLGNPDEACIPGNVFGVCELPKEIGVELRPKNVLRKLENIKKIVLPSTLKKLTIECFCFMQDGKCINIPKGLTKNVLWLRHIKWKKFSISSQHKKYKAKNSMILSKNGKKVYAFVGPQNKVIVPNGVTTIGEKAFEGTKVTSINIPKTVCKIENEAFNNLAASHFQITEKNKNYGTANNCIYSKKSGRLVVAIAKSGVVNIPKQVTCIKEGTSFVGAPIQKIIFPKTLKRLGNLWSSSMECVYRAYMELIFKGENPPIVESAAYLPECTVYVKKGTKSKYKKALKDQIRDEYTTIQEK